MRCIALPLLTALLTTWIAPPARAGDGDLEDRIRALEERLRLMHGELEALRAEAARRSDAEARQRAEVQQAVEVLAEEVENQRLGEAASERAPESRHGLGPAASKVYGVERGVSIGGYGEMLYESFDSALDDGSRSSKRDQLDFLRAILYFGYKFSDRIVFNSEIEFEHASTGEDGEVSVEFAYLDFLLRDEINLRAGMLLTPVGFVNELHEPPVFLGARRPTVEQRVIPTTWRENGIGLFGSRGPFSYRAYLLAGLDASEFSAGSGLRGGRQKGSKSLAEDFALAARVDVEPSRGLTIGASGYFGRADQDLALDGEQLDVRTDLVELHLEWRYRGARFRALWSQAEVSDVAELNEALGLSGDDSIGERIEGWYAEIGYDVLAHVGTEQQLTPYVRWEELDTQARVPAGFLRDPANDLRIFTVGVQYAPHPQVVLKVDWQDVDDRAGTGQDQVNVALGFLF